MKTKKDVNYSYNHTKDRILERYDFKITRALYDGICEDIKEKSPDVTVIDVETQKDDTQMIVDIKYKFIPILRVVWSDKRQCITTAIKRR